MEGESRDRGFGLAEVWMRECFARFPAISVLIYAIWESSRFWAEQAKRGVYALPGVPTGEGGTKENSMRVTVYRNV